MRTPTVLALLSLALTGCRGTSDDSGIIDADGDGVGVDDDCNDGDAAVFPGAAELCNGIDDDCDGEIDADADDAVTWYADADTDGYGDAAVTAEACDAPTGHVSDATDCDDSLIEVHPAASEECNGTDDDCDGQIDEAGSVDESTWYADTDGDGHGDPTTTTTACDQPTGYLATDSDCDDTTAAVSPDADELCNDIDDDCDDLVDDADDDATDPATWYADTDGDGFGDATSSQLTCDAPADHVADDTDCDDAVTSTHPGAAELCNTIDDDCDDAIDEDVQSTWYLDGDGDGHGLESSTLQACDQPDDHVASADDCADDDAAISPSATEVCNDVDDDCDTDVDDADDSLDLSTATTWYADSDGDDYGDPSTTATTCDAPTDHIADAGDCADDDDTINPDATEVYYDGVDANCDGASDYDADEDGHDSADHGGDDLDDDDPTCATDCAPDGTTQDDAVSSCAQLLADFPGATSGTYWLDIDGDGDTSNAVQMRCEMDWAGGGWTPCFAGKHGNDADGFEFTWNDWGSKAPALEDSGNRCVTLAPGELFGEVYTSSAAESPQIRTGAVTVDANAFANNQFNGYSNDVDCIGLNNRPGFGSSQIGGTTCGSLTNGRDQGSGVAISNGTKWRGLHGRLNNGGYGIQMHMCVDSVWCGTDGNAWILLYGR